MNRRNSARVIALCLIMLLLVLGLRWPSFRNPVIADISGPTFRPLPLHSARRRVLSPGYSLNFTLPGHYDPKQWGRIASYFRSLNGTVSRRNNGANTQVGVSFRGLDDPLSAGMALASAKPGLEGLLTDFEAEASNPLDSNVVQPPGIEPGYPHVAPGDHVTETMLVYNTQYDQVSNGNQAPRWEIDDLATQRIADTTASVSAAVPTSSNDDADVRNQLYTAMTTRPFTATEMLSAITYGATLNAAPVTSLSGDQQAQALRNAWTTQALLQWQATHQQLATQYATTIQQVQAIQAYQLSQLTQGVTQ